MDVPGMLREALELQILEQRSEQAAGTIGAGVTDHGAAAVAGVLLEAASVSFRRMVSETGETLDLADLLARLALDGAVPEQRLELLTEVLTAAAATAGGIRPSVDALHNQLGEQDLVFGAWLGVLTALRIASMTLEVTEAELLEDVLLGFDVGA